MCKWTIPKQYAYVDPNAEPGKDFRRFENPIISDAHLKACRGMLPHTSEYLSVYSWAGWNGGEITQDISKTAIIDGVFLDFDDSQYPEKAIMDAAEVAQYVGHSTCNFSGAKGAHVLIHCYPVGLIPDLKSSVLRGFANMLANHLPELLTMDWAVIGDTSRVHRIIDSVHPGTKLHAIGLTAAELSLLTIDEIKEMAQNRRRLVQVPKPSQWVTDELYHIEEEIIIRRFMKLFTKDQISVWTLKQSIKHTRTPSLRNDVYKFLETVEAEWHRIRANQQLDLRGSVIRGEKIGSTQEETWLIHAVIEFKATGRAATGSRRSEHKARVHLAKLADECGWTFDEICNVYTGADDYDPEITKRMVRSCIRRR